MHPLDALPLIPSPAVLWRSLRFWIWAVFIVLLAAAIPDVVVTYWLFESLGKTSVFWTTFNAQLTLFAITGSTRSARRFATPPFTLEAGRGSSPDGSSRRAG